MDAYHETYIQNVFATANGAGGTKHFALFLHDAELTVENSRMQASGASDTNAAVGVFNIVNGFPQPLISNSTLIGGTSVNDSTGTGLGIQLIEASPEIRNSVIEGGHRAVWVSINGHPIIHNSKIGVGGQPTAFLFEANGSSSISVGASGVSYLGNKFTGDSTSLRCVHSYAIGTFAPVSDGTTVSTACN